MSDEVKLLPCEMQAVKHLKQCAKDAANSGSYFNQGVVRGLEIAAAQIEHGHHRTRAIEATRPTEQGLGVPTSVPNAALAGADDWKVGPCVNHLGNVTSWDICLPRAALARGVAVVASVYSGEVVARAILAAIQAAAVASRRAALTRMMQLDEEFGILDDEADAHE